MRILAVDTSSQSASCALTEDGRLLGECFTNVRLTHSQTLMPMIEGLFAQTQTSIESVDLFAVTEGPGSLTGLRIGLSAVKGMAHALGRACVGISTLEALAWNLCGIPCVVAPVLDARCNQVYTALFRWTDNGLERLFADEAIALDTLAERLENLETPLFLVGDGAQMCYNKLNGRLQSLRLPTPALLYARASSAALAAAQRAATAVPPAALAPVYLRLPQAERERLAKAGGAPSSGREGC